MCFELLEILFAELAAHADECSGSDADWVASGGAALALVVLGFLLVDLVALYLQLG